MRALQNARKARQGRGWASAHPLPTYTPVLCLALIYLATRLPFLAATPLHWDEPVLLHWGQIAFEPSFLFFRAPPPAFVSVAAGNPPLHPWALAAYQLLPLDPVVAGRLLSISTGLGTALLTYTMGRILASPLMAFVAALLYVLSPYTVLYDRLALTESMLTLELTLCLLFSLQLVRSPRLDIRLLSALGLTSGLAMLTKFNSLLFLAFLPLLAILSSGKHPITVRLTRLTTLLVALICGYMIYYVIFGRNWGRFAWEFSNIHFILSTQELLTLPMGYWLRNTQWVFGSIMLLITPPLALFAIMSIITLRGSDSVPITFAILVVGSICAYILVGKVIAARYFLFLLPPLSLLLAHCVVSTPLAVRGWLARLRGVLSWRRSGRNHRLAIAGLLAALLLLPFATDLKILLSPSWVIQNGLGHGYGKALSALRVHLAEEGSQEPINLLVHRSGGPVNDGAFVVLRGVANVRLFYYTPFRNGKMLTAPWVPEDAKLLIYDPWSGLAHPRRSFDGARVYLLGEGAPPPGTAAHVELVRVLLDEDNPSTSIHLFEPRWDAAYWDGPPFSLRDA